MKCCFKWAGIVLLAAGLAGCAGFKEIRTDVDQDAARDLQKVKSELDKPLPSRQAGAVEFVSSPWIVAGKPVVINTAKALPAAVDHFVYTFDDRVGLATLAERITALSGIPVRLAPDVFLPASRLLPMAAGATNAAATPAATASTASGKQSSSSGAVSDNDYGLTYEGPYDGSLAGLLDLVSAKAGIAWEYSDNILRLYRTTTKTFAIHVLPGTTDVQASVGKGGSSTTGTQSSSGSSGGGGSITGTSQSSSSVHQTSLDKIEATVKLMLSPIGRASVTSAGVTVTDIFDVVERVGQYIDRENGDANRQVSFRIEVISLTSNKSNDFGIDWTVVATRMKGLSPSSSLTFQGPQSGISSVAGSLGYAVVAGDPSAPNALNGSQVLFKALSTLGTTRLMRRTGRTTANNQPTAIAIVNTDGFLARTTPAASTLGGTGGTPGLEPGSVTTGFVLNLLPSILENDRVMVQVSLDISSLRGKIPTYTSGGQQIMVPNTSGYQFLDRVSLRAGQTAVLTAFEGTTGSYSKQGIFDGGSFGESSSQMLYEAVLVLVTPVIVEG